MDGAQRGGRERGVWDKIVLYIYIYIYIYELIK